MIVYRYLNFLIVKIAYIFLILMNSSVMERISIQKIHMLNISSNKKILIVIWIIYSLTALSSSGDPLESESLA